MADQFPPGAVAIVGLAGRFPGADGLDEFWRNIRDGVESLETFSDADLDAAGVSAQERADPRFVARGTPLADALCFDADFFGITPREAELIDPQHRVFLECAWEAMEHAGYGPGTPAGVVGVYGGAGMNTYLLDHVLRNPEAVASAGGYQLMLGNDKDFLCSRVSYKLDLRGPSVAVQTACSTSLVAVETACRALQRGACDLALAGGVSIGFPERAGYRFEEGMIFSPDGRCRPFDRAAAGTRAGAGAGIVVLKLLDRALADGDTIHAVIRGIAVNNDGAAKIGYTAPGLEGQVQVIGMAQALADVEPASIGYAETHGTATPLGDAVEIAALKRAFGDAPAAGFCRLGALKANIGHLDVAAGVAGLIKTVLVLKHRELPPLANFAAANPALAIEGSAFSVSAAAAPWNGSGPRRACVSSFGIGGTNAHAVLEEAPVAPAPSGADGGRPELLVLSAKTATALDAAAARLADHLATHPEQALASVAWTLRGGRKAFAHRRALVAGSHEEAVTALRRPAGPSLGAVHEGGVRPVVFLFSGQGSQRARMGAGLYEREPSFRGAVDRCAALFEPELGLDIRSAMFGGDDAALARTALAQPALFCLEYALTELWRENGIVPAAMLGHSIGEYVACVLAGVMSLDDACRVVAARGRLMEAMPPGGMASAFAPAAALVPHLSAGVEIAALNAPELCTIAGPSAALAESLERLARAGIESSLLRTSHAFHTAAMAEAAAALSAVLAGVALAPPAIPYLSNLTGTWITPEQATSPAYYAEHLRHAVRFADGIRTLAGDPSRFFLEIGPGRALATLARANLPPENASLIAASLPRAGDPGTDARDVLEATAKLWLAGAPVAAPPKPRRVPLPTYPFERRLHVVARTGVVPGPQAASPAADDATVRCYAPVWVRDDAPPAPSLEGVWLVTGRGGALTDAVLAALDQAGAIAVPVRPGSSPAAALGGRALAGVMLLDGVEDTEPDGRGRRLYDALVALAADMETLPDKGRVQVLAATSGARSVLDEPVTSPEAALPLGAALALPAELSWLAIRTVDLPPAPAPALAALMVREARSAGSGPDVAWRGGRRWLRRFDPLALDGDAPWPRRGGTYLITGGLGGLGLTLAGWLARRDPAARLLLTGRRHLAPGADPEDPALAPWARAAARAIRDIEAAGGEVLTAAADAADPVAMRSALAAAAARFGGPPNGVIHAAGNPGCGKLALRQNDADVTATLAPKVGGLAVLRDLLGETNLDFVALMGSINAVVSAPGVSDYAAANVVLDAFAEGGAHPAGWRRVVAIDWSAWADVGMAATLDVPAALRASHAEMLRTAIPAATGAETFGRILASGRERVVVTSYDLSRALAGTPPRTSAAADGSPVTAAPARARSERAGKFEPPSGAAELALAAIWTELIGVADIGAHDDFFELGGHSLLATRVLSRIGQSLGAQLTLREFFEEPTIRGLGRRIAGSHDQQQEREEFLL
jgi:acyl transferase domain-containing protein